MDRKTSMACNFKCVMETEGLLKVDTGTHSHIHCKCKYLGNGASKICWHYTPL